MKYADGQTAFLGDEVRLGDAIGKVVCSIDTDQYTSEFPKEIWSYLQIGAMIQFDLYGLIHYEKAEADLILLARG